MSSWERSRRPYDRDEWRYTGFEKLHVTKKFKTSLEDDNQNLYCTLFECLQRPIKIPEVHEEEEEETEEEDENDSDPDNSMRQQDLISIQNKT